VWRHPWLQALLELDPLSLHLMWALLPVMPMAKAITPHIRSWTRCCIQLYSMNLVQTKWIMKFPICSNKRMHVGNRLIACTYCRGKPNAVLQPWCIAMAPHTCLKHLLWKRILWPICSMMINLLSFSVMQSLPDCALMQNPRDNLQSSWILK
jgi:hypothetical protein